MAKLIDKTVCFIKDETVFSISLILAILSSFLVKPEISYINWETIILLFVIMVIVEILKNLTVFEVLVRKLLNRIKNTRELLFILVFICFFSSIFITNDVSLIIFVPFAIMALKNVKRADLIIATVSLQTIAANVGCMVLPIGAPHNIVLFTTSEISFSAFFIILLPYIIVSMLFITVILLFTPKDDIRLSPVDKIDVYKKNFMKRVLKGVDYYLILTFIALFILIGNMEHISFFSYIFKQCIVGNEILCGVVASQIISNVPAAMLLSGFSSNTESIIIGINIGGFGTLIASMANLISYNIIIREYKEHKHKYLIVFSTLNVVLLIILLSINVLLKC